MFVIRLQKYIYRKQFFLYIKINKVGKQSKNLHYTLVQWYCTVSGIVTWEDDFQTQIMILNNLTNIKRTATCFESRHL